MTEEYSKTLDIIRLSQSKMRHLALETLYERSVGMNKLTEQIYYYSAYSIVFFLLKAVK